MALSRYLAHAMLVFALASGCNQSLFEDGNGGEDPDGSPGPIPPDGRPGMAGDGSMPPMRDGSMVGQPDGGGPDAAVPLACPAPCAGDAHADFDGQQGGNNGRWRYLEFESEGKYADMTYDSSSGWLGSGSSPPSIVTCNVGATEPPCAELGGTLALTSSGPSGPHPALRWTAQAEGTYLVTALSRGASTAPPSEILLTVTHDNGSVRTPLTSQTIQLTTEMEVVQEETAAMAGDNIVLTIQPVADGSVTVGLDLFISVF